MSRNPTFSLLWITTIVFLIAASGCAKATPTPTPTPTQALTPTSTPMHEPIATATSEPPPLPSQAARHSIGPTTAPVTIVDISDFRCTNCRTFSLGPGRQIIEKYVAEGTVRYGVIQFPVLGEASFMAAIASECAAEQGNFWEYHDQLYEKSATQGSSLYTGQGFSDLAGDLGLEFEQFKSCRTDGRPVDQLKADWEVAVALGVRGVPTIFIDDAQYEGPRAFKEMSAWIEEVLANR